MFQAGASTLGGGRTVRFMVVDLVIDSRSQTSAVFLSNALQVIKLFTVNLVTLLFISSYTIRC